MSEYIVRHNVPILDEHVLRDEDGKELVNVDANKLHDIARKNNERVRRTGDLTPIIIGHTKDDADEGDQPEIVGYASHFRVRPLFRTGRKAIHARFHFFKDKVGKARQFPRRSVELWLSDWKIDPIALLGATTPERDLGLLRLSRHGGKKLRRVLYEKNMITETQDNGDGNGIAQQVVSLLEQTDWVQWVKSQMEAEMAAEQAPPLPEGDMDAVPMDGEVPEGEEFDDGDFGDEDEGEYEDEDPDDDYEDDEEDEDEPRKYSASVASGTNTCPPASINHQRTRKMSKTNGRPQRQATTHDVVDRIRVARDAKASRDAQVEHALVSALDQIRDLKVRYQRAERERDLIQLEAEGYDFDRVEELDAVTGLKDDEYGKYLGRIRKRYQRAPLGKIAFSASDLRSSAPTSKGRSKDRTLEIVEHAQKKGISYAQALEEMEG